MYDGDPDPYCYPGTTVLKNLLGLRDQAALDGYEAVLTALRAGKLRTVRIAKGGSVFCYPEHIDGEMRRVFAELRDRRLLRGLDAAAFARGAAHVLADLNAIHPFREGNGRTQLTYLAVLAARAGHPLALERMDPAAMLAAMNSRWRGSSTV